MMTLTVRIAEFTVRLETEDSGLAGYLRERFAAQAGPLTALSSEPDLTLQVVGGYGQAFTNFEVKAEQAGGFTLFRRTDYRLTVDGGVRGARAEVYDTFALKHAMIHLFSMLVTHRGWGLLIHSSCLLDSGKAQLFAGHSGAGKSTVVQLSWPRPILSDEATIVKVGEDGILIYNSPFRSDTDMPEELPSAYPLGGIHLLRQSLHNGRSRKAGVPALTELLNRVFYWAYAPEETGKVLQLCKKLLDRVPVYELYFQKNSTFWEEIS